MKFFADTADTADIRDLAETGLLDGVTTNPSLIHKAGRDFLEVVREIAGIVDGPVSAEVVALDHDGMMREAEILRKIADNIAVKVPLTVDGLKTCKKLTADGTMVNVTLCFSANQALLAAKAGATFISPFLGLAETSAQPRQRVVFELVHPCHSTSVSRGGLISYNAARGAQRGHTGWRCGASSGDP